MVFLGQGIGSYSWGFASDKFGRKKVGISIIYLLVKFVHINLFFYKYI